MKKMFRYAKTLALVITGASLMVGCQKDNGSPDLNKIQTESGEVGIKIATKVDAADDERDFGAPENWIGNQGSLSLLKPGLPSVRSDLFVNVPSGIKVTKKSYVYVTFVGEVADYNNVLGYYTYNEGALNGNLAADRAYIMNQIFDSGANGVNFDRVVYYSSKEMQFKTTYRLDNNGKEFDPGTIIGFYLLPNSSNGSVPKVEMRNGYPAFIATDKSVNTPADMPQGGKISHLMGRSACGDLVVAFEDLNSMYSQKSDEDYNDLVFVVGDNLETRKTSSIEAYGGVVLLEELPVLGETCVTCIEALSDLSSLINYVTNKPANSIYEPLFNTPNNIGYFPVIEQTPLYVKFAFAAADWYNTIGWFPYADGQTVADIKSVILDQNGNVKEQYIIAKDIHNIVGGSVQAFLRIGGAGYKFAEGTQIGFFILPKFGPIGNQPVSENVVSGREMRFTTQKSNNRQTQVILRSSCNNVVVAFEDNSAGDEDYNDVIFYVSDNNASTGLKTININNENFFCLCELLDRYIAGGSPQR